MIHLGIHYGHNATVAIIENGRLIFCQSEERLNRIKNSTGFPENTIAYIYKNLCSPDDVATATFFQESIFGYRFLKAHGFQPFQYGNYLSPEVNLAGFFAGSEIRWRLSQFRAKKISERNKKLIRESSNFWSQALSIREDRLRFVHHHAAHAYSVYPNIKNWDEALVFTLDGVGDYLSATVWELENGNLSRILAVDHRNSLGYFYSAVTGLLGMKSGEHEFKVMGLAPYASLEYYEPILNEFRKMITVDDQGRFKAAFPPSNIKYAIDKVIRHQRFDNVAGAIQALTEELIIKWVEYWIKSRGISKVALSGGVFMNVKACQKVSELGSIDRLFVMPSAADESTAIGAAVYGSLTREPGTEIAPLQDLYLGHENEPNEIDAVINRLDVASRYNVSRPENINHTIAKLLADHKIVARCSGKMEFGARALGNRSILANPSRFDAVEEINSSIKSRDFWMPFTPSILEGDMDRYIENHAKIFAPYMCITFNSKSLARNHLKAAIHPRDKTVRPQCVLASWNKDYYDIISEFKNLTGIGGILNTSFNLHGQPNVCSPEDAIYTLDNSGLSYLALGPYLLSKK